MGTIGELNPTARHFSRSELAKAINTQSGALLLPGGAKQYYDEESATQNYAIGSRQVVGMTVYHYARMEASSCIDVSTQEKAVGNSHGLDEQNTAAVPASVAIGAMHIDIIDAASAAHVYVGARLAVYPVAAEVQIFDVIDNDASDGTNVRLYLNRPVRVAIAAGTFTSIYRSIYSAVEALQDIATGLAPAVGVPQRYVTAGYYFWLPTWGAVQIVQGEALDGTDGPDVVFSRVDGSVWKKSTSIGAADSWQHAGRMLAEQTAGIDAGIFLELDS